MIIIEFGSPDINFQTLTLFEYAQIWTIEKEDNEEDTILLSYKGIHGKVVRKFKKKYIERRI